jgi:hypothetical protein
MNALSSVPALYCPFPSIVVDQAMLESSSSRLANWLERFPLCSNAQTVARYLASSGPELCALTTPYPMHAEAFQTYVDFIVWFFVLDDTFCDELAPGESNSYLTVLPHLASLFDEPVGSASMDNAFVAALADIRGRLLEFGSRREVARFGATLREFLLCLVWELQVRASGQLPGYLTYRSLRRRTAGTLPCLFLSSLVSGADPDDTELAHPDVAAMTSLAVDHVGLSNDLFSAAKEAAVEETPLQLPLVLMREHDCGLDHAVQKSSQICDDIVQEFLRHRQSVERDASPALLGYFDVLQGWMRGNIDWSLSCGRYNM